eukprot:1461731-Rhodomonas_salina.2
MKYEKGGLDLASAGVGQFETLPRLVAIQQRPLPCTTHTPGTAYIPKLSTAQRVAGTAHTPARYHTAQLSTTHRVGPLSWYRIHTLAQYHTASSWYCTHTLAQYRTARSVAACRIRRSTRTVSVYSSNIQ